MPLGGTLNAQRTILIVDEDWLVGEGMREMLRAGGFKVVGSARTCEQASALAREHRPRIAVIDLNPVRLERCVALASQLGDLGVSVIFTSAHCDADTLGFASQARPLGVVAKPYSWAQLHATLVVALAHATPMRG